jgi:Bacteriophage Lambda NinG protein
MIRRTNFQQKKSFSKKPPRVMSERYLVAELDAITSIIVRKQESACFIIGCQKRVDLENGHLFERRHRWTRWDTTLEGNCHAQCPKHNQEHESNFTLYQDSYIQRFGERAFDDLANRAHSNQKITYSDLLELLEEKKLQLESLKAAA